MTNKSTKRAFLTSLMALLLSFTMLIGTTYAWFTDSVSSANNIIKSGNLDVELDYAKVVDGVMSDWATVQGEDEVFDPNALWEPGRVEVVYLRVSNLGSLALKYQLNVTVLDETPGTNVDGDEFLLSDHLVFKAIEMPDALTTYTDREAAELAAGSIRKLSDYCGITTNLEVKGVDYVALVVYMPTDIGNVANFKTGTDVPTIELGIDLYATQTVAEDDSFGSDYDENAWHPGMTVYSAEDLQAALAENSNVKLGSDIVLTEDWSPIGTAEAPFIGKLDGNGYTISNLTATGTDNVALIAYAGNNVTIKNLNLENVNISSDKYAAGVVGTAGTGLVIDNVTVSGTINATSYAAGLVFEAEKATITNCENNAAVTAGRASGVASWISNATVTNVVNNGDIAGGYSAAGIANRFSGAMAYATNNGTITGNGTEATGGIVGIQLSAESTYEYCVNNGDVTTTADNPNASAAGILAQTPSKKATFNYCINTGKITAEQSYAAGIGYSLYGNIVANYCYNSGDVAGADGAGGIAPKAQYGANDTANHCVVDATVTSANGKVYYTSNKVNNSFYYNADVLTDKAGAAITAKAAKNALDAATGGVFFKVVDGRLTASFEYNWVGDVKVSTLDELNTALNNAVDGDVIIIDADITGAVVIPSNANNITIDGKGFTLNGSINLNGSSNKTIKNIEFDAAGAARDPNGSFFTNIMFRNGNVESSQNITIDGCKFNGTFEQYSAYACIYTYDQGLSGARLSNVTITNCEFNALAYASIKLDYADVGTITVTNNKFNDFYAYAVNPGTSNSSDIIFQGNTVVFTSNFNPAGAALMSASRNGSHKITFNITGNTFTTDVATAGFNPSIVALRPGTGYYNAGNCEYTFSGNTFAGKLAGLTEATVNATLPY